MLLQVETLLGPVYWIDFLTGFLDSKLGYHYQPSGGHSCNHIRVVLAILTWTLLRYPDSIIAHKLKPQVLWVYGGHTQYPLSRYFGTFATVLDVTVRPITPQDNQQDHLCFCVLTTWLLGHFSLCWGQLVKFTGCLVLHD
jgi:hypothetical protein